MKRAAMMMVFVVIALVMTTGVFATPQQETAGEAVPSYYLTSWANRPVWPAHEDNVMIQGLEEKFGVSLNVEIVPTEYSQKLTLQAATGSLPDAFTSTVAWPVEVSWARDGLLLDLTDRIATELPNYLKVRTQQPVWDSMEVDGRFYSLPSIDNPQDGGPQIRKDWLESLGISAPRTLEEFRNVARAFTFNDPNKSGANDTFAGAIFQAGMNHGPHMIVWGAFDAFPNLLYQEGGQYTYGAIRPQFRDALGYMREMVMEGLFSVASIDVTDWNVMQNEMYSGKYGIFYFPVQIMTSADDRTIRLSTNTGGRGEMVGFNHIPTADGRRIAPAFGLRPWNRTALKAEIKQPEKLLAVFNYMMSEEGSNYVFYGVEGTHFNWRNGVVDRTPAYQDPIKLYNEGFDEQFLLFSFRSLFGPHLDPPALEAHRFIMQNLRYAPLYPSDLEAWPRASVALNNLQTRFILRALSEKDFNLDAEFATFVREWRAAGGDAVLAEANARAR